MRLKKGGLTIMSRLNGDRARFQKERKRKVLHRQRLRALIAKQRQQADHDSSPRAASLRRETDGRAIPTRS